VKKGRIMPEVHQGGVHLLVKDRGPYKELGEGLAADAAEREGVGLGSVGNTNDSLGKDLCLRQRILRTSLQSQPKSRWRDCAYRTFGYFWGPTFAKSHTSTLPIDQNRFEVAGS
jgi:hypothetical protein